MNVFLEDRFRKRPHEVRAFRLTIDVETWPVWAVIALGRGDLTRRESGTVEVSTREGRVAAYPEEDWIVEGIKDELYPCKHEIFIETYDAITEDGVSEYYDSVRASYNRNRRPGTPPAREPEIL